MSLEGAEPLLSPLKNDEKLIYIVIITIQNIMGNIPTIKDNTLVIITSDNVEIAVLETSQNDERNILSRLVIAISILFSFGLNVIMKDFWKTLKLLASEEGKDFIGKYVEQAVFSDKKVEISSNNGNGQYLLQRILQCADFKFIIGHMRVLEGTYLDYKLSDDCCVPPSIRNMAEKNYNVSVQSLQNLFGDICDDTSPLRHNTYDGEYPDFDLVSIKINN